jgi:hypothetical protein
MSTDENQHRDTSPALEEGELIQLEPMYYSFNELQKRDVLSKIKEFTNNFASLSADQAFIDSLTEKLDTDGSILEGYLYAPTDPDVCRQVIGKDGCYFHMTTQKQDIAMIWHDRSCSRPVFRFWGEKQNLVRAMNAIRYRIALKSKSE